MQGQHRVLAWNALECVREVGLDHQPLGVALQEQRHRLVADGRTVAREREVAPAEAHPLGRGAQAPHEAGGGQPAPALADGDRADLTWLLPLERDEARRGDPQRAVAHGRAKRPRGDGADHGGHGLAPRLGVGRGNDVFEPPATRAG